jgi:hypothetical protein
MTIREITIAELPEFLETSLYKGSRLIPVTPERVVSQVNNPRARATDVVLIVAYTDDGQLAGFVGMLPDTAFSKDGSFRFAWNSCWWVDPELGREISLKLFYRSIQVWKGYYMITELTRHTRKIIELTRLFYFGVSSGGVKIQIRSDIKGKVRRNFEKARLILPLAAIADGLINFFISRRLEKWGKQHIPKELTIQYLSRPDEESLGFMANHNQQELCRRGKEEFKWIFSYPWLAMNEAGRPSVSYPFSWQCRHFELFMARVFYNGKPIALAMLSDREGYCKIPYAWFDDTYGELFASAIFKILIERKAPGIYTFRKQIMEFAEKNGFPALQKKMVSSELAISREIAHLRPEDFILQDGDGDAVFT